MKLAEGPPPLSLSLSLSTNVASRSLRRSYVRGKKEKKKEKKERKKERAGRREVFGYTGVGADENDTGMRNGEGRVWENLADIMNYA